MKDKEKQPHVLLSMGSWTPREYAVVAAITLVVSMPISYILALLMNLCIGPAAPLDLVVTLIMLIMVFSYGVGLTVASPWVARSMRKRGAR